MTVVLVRPPVPASIRTKVVNKEIVKVLTFYGDISAKRRGSVVAGWKNEKPAFIDIVSSRTDKIRLDIQMTGPELGRKKWIWLSFGTRVRWAPMTPDFEAKTKAGSFFSGKGRGGLDPSGEWFPRPGIKAREWDKLSRERDKKILDQEIPRAASRSLWATIAFLPSRQSRLEAIRGRIS
jgi:hypothetical protein